LYEGLPKAFIPALPPIHAILFFPRRASHSRECLASPVYCFSHGKRRIRVRRDANGTNFFRADPRSTCSSYSEHVAFDRRDRPLQTRPNSAPTNHRFGPSGRSALDKFHGTQKNRSRFLLGIPMEASMVGAIEAYATGARLIFCRRDYRQISVGRAAVQPRLGLRPQRFRLSRCTSSA
jgi:hypothetical protein